MTINSTHTLLRLWWLSGCHDYASWPLKRMMSLTSASWPSATTRRLWRMSSYLLWEETRRSISRSLITTRWMNTCHITCVVDKADDGDDGWWWWWWMIMMIELRGCSLVLRPSSRSSWHECCGWWWWFVGIMFTYLSILWLNYWEMLSWLSFIQ